MAELKDLEAGQGASQPPQGPTLSLFVAYVCRRQIPWTPSWQS